MAIKESLPGFVVEDNDKPFQRLDFEDLPIQYPFGDGYVIHNMDWTIFLLTEGQAVISLRNPTIVISWTKLILTPYMVINYSNYLEEIMNYVICKLSVGFGESFSVPPKDTRSPFYPYWVKLQELNEFFRIEKERTYVNQNDFIFNSSDIIQGSFNRDSTNPTIESKTGSFSKYFIYAIIAYFIFFKRKF